jgi:hypothetical protein
MERRGLAGEEQGWMPFSLRTGSGVWVTSDSDLSIFGKKNDTKEITNTD